MNIIENRRIRNNLFRPNAKKYIVHIFENYIEMSGDRICGDDNSLTGGIGFLEGKPVTIIGQLSGGKIEEQIKYNFSMTNPEGFRKSLRLMKQAEKFNRPVVCFVDTVGAFLGQYAEEHGQITAISNNLRCMMDLKVPIITILIGNGCSGGALALCIANKLAVLEYATLSVISPKAYAKIILKNIDKDIEAESCLRMSSEELFKLGIVDEVIKEPDGGAHMDVVKMSLNIKEYLIKELKSLEHITKKNLVAQRHSKFRHIRSEEIFL